MEENASKSVDVPLNFGFSTEALENTLIQP